MKLLVVSMCKDEAETVGQVLDRIPKKISGIDTIEKWVIDDGSTDNTAAEAKKHGAKVLSDGVHKKLAHRFREATELALSRGADVMVNIDGDLQFMPEEIPELIKPIIKNEADFVAADRFTDAKTGRRRRPENMPLAKYWSNKMGAKVIGKFSKRRFADVTCGFRAYNRNALYALNLHGSYTYTQESFQVLAMKNMRITSVPTTIKYYPGRKSRVVRNFSQFLFGSSINILRAYRDYAPLRFFGGLGGFFFVVGLICLILTGIHWIVTSQITPYKFLGFAGLYFITLSFVVWIVGIMADMLDRLLGNQEKIIERLKRTEYGDDPKDTDTR
ncbi:MAG TPA: glycosyltransferase family 2 protein [Candidatus Saccharimonadales bacterium]|nr:glycosyltransferase family 2 protein [Candidatus Saccharimonadales bacterium]